MFDVAPTELLLVAVVALVVIGPKDLPKAMRFVGYWVGRARGVMRQFRSGFDTMVRESELQDMEKKWAEENERIMREHPQPTQTAAEPADAAVAADAPPIMTEQPIMLEKPVAIEKPVVVEPALVAAEPAPTESGEGAAPPPKPRKPRVKKVQP